jgi:OmcA/MtrC family decaheme c-type cytochrome
MIRESRSILPTEKTHLFLNRAHEKLACAALLAVLLGMPLVAQTSRKPGSVYGPHDKAFYADAASVQFVNPGLTIKINSASVAANGTITTTYTITDPTGLPLDAAGINTPGTVGLSYMAAYIPATQEQYIAYTTKTATGTLIPTTIQAGADSGGVLTALGSGQYQYVFKTIAPAGYDVTATHSIGIYGSRVLTAYGLTTNYASAVYNFVPNGAPVTKVRDVVETATCNACHDQLSAHGGSRREVQLCVMCHTPQTIDPNTGNTVDFKVFIHKLHMGSSLPSVIAGKPYQIISTFGTSDYSAVVYPAMVQRCTTCHSQTAGAKQATAYLTTPTAAACGSCHDDVNLATGVNHAGGPQPNDAQCSTCHVPQGELPFDASIIGAHTVPTDSTLLSGINAAITKVSSTAPGQAPTVTFTVTDKTGAAIPLASLGSISLTMAGPTTDYGKTIFGSNTATPGYVTESAAAAVCTAGVCVYQFTNKVPAGATGTYAMAAEARRTETLLPGTTTATSVEYGAANPVVYFSVDGSPVLNRRTVVALANCNQCHAALSEHGTLRNNPQYCVMCHNPSNTDASTRSMALVAADASQPPQGINFNLLVHRIHFGINMVAAGRNYTVVGHGGSHNDFSNTLFPAMSPTGTATDTKNCSLCHVNGSEQNLTLALNPVTDPQGPLNPIQPISSACTGCHVTLPEAAHTLANTDALGESCTVCHAAGAAYAVSQVHAQY